MGFLRFLGKLFAPPPVEAVDETKRIIAKLDEANTNVPLSNGAIAEQAWNDSFRNLTGVDYADFTKMDRKT